VSFVALTVFLFHLWSKGWSPQFTVLLLPWVLLLLPNGTGIVLAVLLSSLMAGEVAFFATVGSGGAYHWLLAVIVIARTILLVLLTLIAARVLWREGLSSNGGLAVER
jgi:hypothetical protein